MNIPIYCGVSPVGGKIIIHAPGRFIASANNNKRGIEVTVHVNPEIVSNALDDMLSNNEYLRFGILRGLIIRDTLCERRRRELDKLERRGQIDKLHKKIQGYCIGMVRKMNIGISYTLSAMGEFSLGSQGRQGTGGDQDSKGGYRAD
jgi:hypothetical protein